MNILINQCDEKSGEYIVRGFMEFGHRVNFVKNLEVLGSLENLETYDLIILDTFVEGVSGVDICKSIFQKNKKIGVIFISDDEQIKTKVKAFEAGADDYLVRPFSFAELVARMTAIMRRKQLVFSEDEGILRIGELLLNYHTREVKRESKKIELTAKEFLLLEYFMKNKNILLTRTLIKEHIWGIDFISDTNIVDVYMTRLRNKIDKGFKTKFFYTIRGAGYMFKG